MSFLDVLQVLVTVAAVAGFLAQLVRWLRVWQSEQYRPSAVARIYFSWAHPAERLAQAPRRRHGERPWPPLPVLVALVVISDLARAQAFSVLYVAIYDGFYPLGMPWRTTGPRLRVTPEVVVAAATCVALSAGVFLVGVATGIRWQMAGVAMLSEPLTLLVGAVVGRGVSRLRADRALRRVAHRRGTGSRDVVAIVGSHGARSVRFHLTDLLGAATTKSVSSVHVATPGDFARIDFTRDIVVVQVDARAAAPDRLWAALDPMMVIISAFVRRTASDDLAGEPEVRSATAAAEHATCIVVNGDDGDVAAWAAPLRTSGRRVLSSGQDDSFDVVVSARDGSWSVEQPGRPAVLVAPVARTFRANVACALAAASVLAPLDNTAARIDSVQPLAHHLDAMRAGRGALVIDDTAPTSEWGARASLEAFAALPLRGRRWVVTPGIIDVGSRQGEVNAHIALRATELGLSVAAVGRTNLGAMRSGGAGVARRFDTVAKARRWADGDLGAGDGVLLLGSIPDYYL